MPYYGQISNQVFRVLTTDETLQYVYKHPLIEECKKYAEDGSYEVDPNCLDEIHVNYLINLLRGKESLIGFSASASTKVTNPTIHYLANLLVFICMLIYTAYVNKAGRKMPELNPFRTLVFGNLPGYKTRFTILEEGIVPSTEPPTRGSPGFANRQRGITRPGPQSSISISTPEKLLCSGSFNSGVYKGLYEQTQECAVKAVQDTSSRVDREIDILRAENFSNKIQYRACEKINNWTFIAMELALTDLQRLIAIGECRDEINLSEREICKQLVKGVKELHQRNIAHGDLNPTNILATVAGSKPLIKLAGFSLSCRRANPLDLKEFKERLGCKLWHAPEIFDYNYFKFEDFIKADIYSLGCLIAYIMSKGQCEEPVKFLENLRRLRLELYAYDDQIRYEEVQALRCFDLIVCMIDPDPKDRPSIECAANHPALWDEAKSRYFMVDVSEFLSQSSGRTQSSTEKKSRATGFTKRKPKTRGPVEREGSITNNRVEEPSQEPVMLPAGSTDRDKNSMNLRKAIQNYGPEVCRNQEWSNLLPSDLLSGLPRKYDYMCPISLIRLFRNLHNHFTENETKMDAIVGRTEDDLERFFACRFPLLLTTVYKEAQKYKSTFDSKKRFYNPEEDMNLQQRGTSGDIKGMFGSMRDKWSGDDLAKFAYALCKKINNQNRLAEIAAGPPRQALTK